MHSNKSILRFLDKFFIYLQKLYIMKKILPILLTIIQVTFVGAQSLVVTGDTLFTGDLVNQISNHLDIKNTSTNTITVKCQKTNLTLPLGGESFYCFAGNRVSILCRCIESANSFNFT